MKILHFVLCVKAISVLHMEEKMISIDTRTPQTIRDMWMLHNSKDSKQFWCKLSDCKLKPKNLWKLNWFFLVSWLITTCLWVLQITLLYYSRTCFHSEQISMWSHEDNSCANWSSFEDEDKAMMKMTNFWPLK